MSETGEIGVARQHNPTTLRRRRTSPMPRRAVQPRPLAQPGMVPRKWPAKR